MPSPFAEVENGSRVCLETIDGTVVNGEYKIVGGKRYIMARDASSFLGVKVSGPFDAQNTRLLTVTKSVVQVRREQREARLGEPFHKRAPETGPEVREFLEDLARAIAAIPHTGDRIRQLELTRQFADLAATVELSKAKQAWLLAEGRWYRQHNHPPLLSDLWHEDVASPSEIRRPRDADFELAVPLRSVRTPIPKSVQRDPHSIRNMLKALNDVGLRTYLSRLGDPEHDRGVLLVKMPFEGRSQYRLDARRKACGKLDWRAHWDALDSDSGNRRQMRVERSHSFALLQRTLQRGCVNVQYDLLT